MQKGVLKEEKTVLRGVYLTALSQSEASSQQQDDVPGHSLVNHLPVQQSSGSLHQLTCETQMKCEHETVISFVSAG